MTQATGQSGSARFSVAPMMDWTDRHCRFFLRQISRRARLYTEMVTTGALIHGNAARFLAFHEEEHPVALQLGGSEPGDLARCARMAQDWGYDEVNLNVGCPSDRVQRGRFGACLMAEPELVAECVAAMKAEVSIPVTVKTRIGVDDRDSFEELCAFVETVKGSGCQVFIIHARKAWLKGLSPKQNREIPPLNYPRVRTLKALFPELTIVLNGGLLTLEQALEETRRLDGAMLGRAAYQNPYLLAQADRLFFDDPAPAPSRAQVVTRFLPYAEARLSEGVPLKSMTRHILGLYKGAPGAKAWRQTLAEGALDPKAGPELIEAACAQVEARAAEARSAA